jgi:integrase
VLTYRNVETGGAAVASIERRVRDGQLRWYARFRDPAGVQKVNVFNRSSGRPLTKAIAGHEFDAIDRTVGLTVSPHSLRHYFGASLISRGVSVVAVSRWLGHSSPEITYRVYACLKPDDEQAGRDATAKIMRLLLPQMYPMCTEKGAE